MEVSVPVAPGPVPAPGRPGWRDPRLLQMVFQATLLAVGVGLCDFSLAGAQAALAFAGGLGAQLFWLQVLGLRGVGLRSALITCFGIVLLLRADGLWQHPLAAALAISAKFVLRVRGRHLWNPANFGVVLALVLFPGAWASPGQWGQDLALALWFVALGGLVSLRARSSDLAWTFLIAFLGLVALRVAWLGQSWAIWWHQLGNGALLLFAFFMISDPMTAPDHPRARLLYACLVALVAALWQHGLFRPSGPLWALFLCAPLVPLFDRIWSGSRYRWGD